MASRKELITISYHDDDDTGMYEIWELDCWFVGTLDSYVKHYWKEKLIEYIEKSVIPIIKSLEIRD